MASLSSNMASLNSIKIEPIYSDNDSSPNLEDSGILESSTDNIMSHFGAADSLGSICVNTIFLYIKSYTAQVNHR